VTSVNQQLVIISEQITYGIPIDVRVDNMPLVDLTITPLAIFDDNGDLEPPVVTTQKIDLTKCVPDITFGDLVKAIKNWKNMEIKPVGREIYMNYIQPQLDISAAKNLTDYEIEQPRRRFKQGDSFLLKYREVDDPNYQNEQLYVNLNGAFSNSFSKKNTTNEIEIDVIPLPKIFRNGVSTAFAVDKGDSAICAVLYKGANGIENLAEDTDTLRLSAIYDEYYDKWLDFRIRSQAFDAKLSIDFDTFFQLAVNDKVFMYRNYHLIRTLNKTNVPGKNIVEIELELETLK